MAEVTLECLSKVYANGVQAVKDLNLHVADGELVVLIGPSGCGKTTTLRLIAGLEEPTRGIVRIGGQVVNALPPRDRRVAMVFQKPVLYPHLSVRQNLVFSLRLEPAAGRWKWRGLRGFRLAHSASACYHDPLLAQRVADVARLLGLEGVLDCRPGQLSGGQQQRVALGRAIVRQPAVFLLDEPLSHLDARLRNEMRHELHLLQRRLRATMIYVTHDPVEAMTLADRVVVLDQGVVQQIGPPREVYERPCNRLVGGFFGWPSMNFLDGQLIGAEGQLSFTAADGRLSVPPDQARAWNRYAGRSVVLGIRPEDVRIAACGLAAEAGLVMEVALVEPLGGAALVTLQRGNWRLTGRMEGPQLMGNETTVEVSINMQRTHLFDAASGLALDRSGPDG